MRYIQSVDIFMQQGLEQKLIYIFRLNLFYTKDFGEIYTGCRYIHGIKFETKVDIYISVKFILCKGL